MPTDPTRPIVVVLRTLGLGDLLTVVPPLRAIRRAVPDALVYLTTVPWTEPLARHAGLADVFVSPGPGVVLDPSDIVALEAIQLRQPLAGVPSGPDLAVQLRGHRPATYEPLLRLRPKRLVAYRQPDVPASADGPEYDHDEHEVTRWSRLMSLSGIACDPSELRVDPPFIDFGSLGGAIVVHPGAGARSRYWPVDRWAEVIRRFCVSGHRVAVTGMRHEAGLVGAVVAAADASQVADLCGRTSILELTALVADAPLVVCPDTGVGHLATAVGTPSVLLFGPSDPAVWGPPPVPTHRVLWAGRTGDSYGDEPDPGLLELTVEDVWTATESMLA